MKRYDIFGDLLTTQELHQRSTSHGSDLGTLVEYAIVHSYKNWCRSGDVVVDGGASQGWHTFDLAKIVDAGGHVYAFEALPDKIEFLSQRAREWQVSDRITFHHAALSRSEGSATFHRVGDSTGFSGLKRYSTGPSAELPSDQIVVQMNTIDNAITNEHKSLVSYIKLDLEGGEFDALVGGSEVMRRSRPLIISEFTGSIAGDAYGFSDKDFFSFFADRQYSLFDMFGQPYTVDDYYDWSAIGEIQAVPKEKLDTSIHLKIGAFMVSQLKPS